MKLHRIAVDYRISGIVYIQANSVEEAMETALTDVGTTDVIEKEYIDDSWNVNKEMSIHFAEEDQTKE